MIVSDYYEGLICRLIILIGFNFNEVFQLIVKSLGYLIFRSDFLGKGIFVFNDINIGGFDYVFFILFIGFNMGGKLIFFR